MPLADYTHVVTLGSACMGPYQVRREARQKKLPATRYLGPLDWFVVNVVQSIEAIEDDFQGFFDPGKIAWAGDATGAHWHITSSSGILSMHHFERSPGDDAPSARAWYSFGQWLGARLHQWREMLADPKSRILAVRQSDPLRPDTTEELTSLVTTLSAKARGEVTLLGVYFSSHPIVNVPRVVTGRVTPSWPHDADLSRIDWQKDYGHGPAWQGDDASWSSLWERI